VADVKAQVDMCESIETPEGMMAQRVGVHSTHSIEPLKNQSDPGMAFTLMALV